jgi:hypothetical protein
MKIQTISKILRGILIASLAFAATAAQAAGVSSSSSFGIALGQTARVNFLNLSQREIVMVTGRFVDSDGTLLDEFRGEVAPGTTISFDLNRDSISRETNRLQIHVEIDSPQPDTKHAAPSFEVVNNDDGRTMAVPAVHYFKLYRTFP